MYVFTIVVLQCCQAISASHYYFGSSQQSSSLHEGNRLSHLEHFHAPDCILLFIDEHQCHWSSNTGTEFYEQADVHYVFIIICAECRVISHLRLVRSMTVVFIFRQHRSTTYVDVQALIQTPQVLGE